LIQFEDEKTDRSTIDYRTVFFLICPLKQNAVTISRFIPVGCPNSEAPCGSGGKEFSLGLAESETVA
jgi:hypothetical protein